MKCYETSGGTPHRGAGRPRATALRAAWWLPDGATGLIHTKRSSLAFLWALPRRCTHQSSKRQAAQGPRMYTTDVRAARAQHRKYRSLHSKAIEDAPRQLRREEWPIRWTFVFEHIHVYASDFAESERWFVDQLGAQVIEKRDAGGTKIAFPAPGRSYGDRAWTQSGRGLGPGGGRSVWQRPPWPASGEPSRDRRRAEGARCEVPPWNRTSSAAWGAHRLHRGAGPGQYRDPAARRLKPLRRRQDTGRSRSSGLTKWALLLLLRDVLRPGSRLK